MTEKDPNRFYGYKHWTLEEIPRCFYVGKGIKIVQIVVINGIILLNDMGFVLKFVLVLQQMKKHANGKLKILQKKEHSQLIMHTTLKTLNATLHQVVIVVARRVIK
jgi:hypothetical protein